VRWPRSLLRTQNKKTVHGVNAPHPDSSANPAKSSARKPPSQNIAEIQRLCLHIEYDMASGNLKFPVAYAYGTAYFFAPTEEYSGSFFGGPSKSKVEGQPTGQSPLHHIISIAAREIPPLGEQVPFFYGMRYDGCSLSYKLGKYGFCKLLEIEPCESSPDWPYLDYPPLLPYIPLRVAESNACSAEEFARLAWQGADIKRNCVTVIVPPIFVGGVSMWGPDGDGEGVQIIFQYDLKKRTVRASNQCT
jgi:hypothetical protein